MVRIMPHLESLSLFKAEESNEEAAALLSLAIATAQSPQPEYVQENVPMEDVNPTATLPVIATEQEKIPPIQPQDVSEVPSQHRTNDWNQNQHEPERSIPHPVVPSSMTPLINNFGEEFRTQATPTPMHLKTQPFPQDQEEEEDMPVINMSSDSEIEESV
jgi:hypothetical protein